MEDTSAPLVADAQPGAAVVEAKPDKEALQASLTTAHAAGAAAADAAAATTPTAGGAAAADGSGAGADGQLVRAPGGGTARYTGAPAPAAAGGAPGGDGCVIICWYPGPFCG
jgi:hypothetical protein